MHFHLCDKQRYVHMLHTEYPVVHTVDQTGTDTECLYTGVCHILPSAIHSEPESRQIFLYHNLSQKKIPEYHRCCCNTGISKFRLITAYGLILPCVPSNCPFFWMLEYNRLWLALCFRAIRLSFHNNVVQS